MSLDISNWKSFRFGDLLTEIYKAKAHAKIELTTSDDRKDDFIPFVTRTEENNSIDCYVLKSDLQQIEPGNAIVIGDTTSTISYQSKPFGTGDHIIVIRANWLNAYTALFVISLLKRERFRYSYGRAFLMNSIINTNILLPASKDGDPDWNSVELFIKKLKHKVISTRILSGHKDIGVNKWKSYILGDLFDVKYGVNLELNALDETTKDDPEAIAFVSRTSENNGITAYVKPIDGVNPQPAGTLTVAGGGSVLSTFLQTRPFYSGRDLYLLLDKNNLSLYMKLFVKVIIEKEKYRFNYGRQANKSLPNMIIKLPASTDGTPDWDWMENYIKSLPYSDRI